MQIKKQTVTVKIYIDSNGKETPLTELPNPHLVSAFAVAVREDDSALPDLKDEILRRLKNNDS